MRQESEEFGHRFAVAIYRWRVPTTILALAFVGWIFTQGIGFVGTQTSSIMQIGDVSDGRGTIDAQLFDPSLDVWFAANDETMGTFREIEDRFVAEDYLVVAFEVPDQPNGVFDRESLSTIERLTDSFLTVPGVRHVRSLTHSPWIRWGPIADADGAEEGLIITDLVESASALSDPEIIERMIAVLGAHAAAARVGEDPIRAVLGPDADFADYIGDPLLLGTLVNTEGTATAIQIQVIRPHVADDIRSEEGEIAADLYTVQYQRRALRGVEHILRRESGRAVPTPEFERLTELLPRMPGSPEKDAMKGAMRDPSRAFVVTMDGTSIQKFHEYEQGSGGQWIDTLDANHLAPSSFSPEILSPYTYRLAGIPTFERNFEITGTADAALLPLAWLATFIALFVLFRSLVSAVLPMVVVLVSVLGTVGALFWSGHLFNNLTAMLPNMMTVIGVADAVHLVAAYLILRPQHSDRRSLLIAVIRRNALPVFLTSITTAVGFYSLLLIDLQPVRELAAAMGFGSLLAYVVTMTLVPLLLSLLPLPKESKPNRAPTGLFSEIRSERLAAWVVRRHRPIIAVSSVLTIVALLGVSRVQIDADPRTMFPKDNKVISEMAWIEEHLGGVGDLELVFSAPGRTEAHPLSPDQVERLEELRIVELGEQAGLEGFDILTMSQRQELEFLTQAEGRWEAGQIGLAPAFLEQLDRFEARLRREMADASSPVKLVTDLTSPLDVLRKIHQVQNENRADHYRVPRPADVHPNAHTATLVFDDFQQQWVRTPGQNASTLVSQYYLQYENGARPGENLAAQLSPDRQHVRMQGRINMASSNEREMAYARIRAIAAEEFSASGDVDSALARVALSGKSMLVDAAGLVIAEGYTRSVAVALAVICVFIGLAFRSVRLAVLSVVPNVLPILVPISLLGFLGISLDGPAIVACSIGLGLGVDDTIHLFSKLRDAERQGLHGEAALAYAFRSCGNAVVITTIVLAIGFLMMATGDFSPNVYIGLLGTIMIIFACLADFVVTPAFFVATENWTAPGGRAVTASALTLMMLSISSPGVAQDVPPEPVLTPASEATYGAQLMEYAEVFDRGWVDEVLQGTMTLVDASGRSVRRTFIRMGLDRGDEGDKIIVRFTSPNDIKGVTALTFENRGSSDDNWLYLPSTKRSRRISGANNTSSFLGSQFTYEDLSSVDPREYNFTYKGETNVSVDDETVKTYAIDAVPTYADTGYSRLTIYLDPQTWRQVKVDYYDLAGSLLKTRFESGLKRFHDRFWRAARIEMRNTQNGKRTILDVDNQLLNLSLYPDSRTGQPRKNLTESVFTTRALLR